MIVVTLELWPIGDKSRAKTIGTVQIGNDATGTPSIGNYRVRLLKDGETWRKGVVRDFPRQKLGAFDLLYRALQDTVGAFN